MANKKEPIAFRKDRLGLEDIKSLLETLEKHEVTEFKLEREEEKIWLKRAGAVEPQPSQSFMPPPQYVYPQAYPPQAVPTQQTQGPALAQAPVANQTSSPLETKSFKEVRSPMVGTFYRRPAVDAEPYVAVGDTVKKGDVLCIVEAMKLMNEIESEVSGKIVEICLEDGQMVEYGEVLFKVE